MLSNPIDRLIKGKEAPDFEQETYRLLEQERKRAGLPELDIRREPNIVDMTVLQLRQKYKPKVWESDYWVGERFGDKGIIDKLLEPRRMVDFAISAPFFMTGPTALMYIAGTTGMGAFYKWVEGKKIPEVAKETVKESITGFVRPFLHPFDSLYDDPYGTLLMWYLIFRRPVKGAYKAVRRRYEKPVPKEIVPIWKGEVRAPKKPSWVGVEPSYWRKWWQIRDIDRYNAIKVMRRLYDHLLKHPEMKPEEFADFIVRRGIKFPATAIPDLSESFGVSFVIDLLNRGAIKPLPALPGLVKDYIGKMAEVKTSPLDKTPIPALKSLAKGKKGLIVRGLIKEEKPNSIVIETTKKSIEIPKTHIIGIKEFIPREFYPAKKRGITFMPERVEIEDYILEERPMPVSPPVAPPSPPPVGEIKPSPVGEIKPSEVLKPYEGLMPGTKEWMRVWKAHPELQKEMLEYAKMVKGEGAEEVSTPVKAEVKSAEAGSTPAASMPEKSEVSLKKELWQMTREEYYEKEVKPSLKQFKLSSKPSMKSLRKEEDRLLNLHKERVQQALSEGKPVPPEVLKDYPDLAEKYKSEMKPVEEAKPEIIKPSKKPSVASFEIAKSPEVKAELKKTIVKDLALIKKDFDNFGALYGDMPKEQFLALIDELFTKTNELPLKEELKKIAENYYELAEKKTVYEPKPEWAVGKEVIIRKVIKGHEIPGQKAKIVDIKPGTPYPKIGIQTPEDLEAAIVRWYPATPDNFKIPVKGHPNVNALPIIVALATGGLLFPAMLEAGIVDDWQEKDKMGIPWGTLILLGAGTLAFLGIKAFKRWKALYDNGLIDKETFQRFEELKKSDLSDVVKTPEGKFFKFRWHHYLRPVETFLMDVEQKTGIGVWRNLYRPVMDGVRKIIKDEIKYMKRVYDIFEDKVKNKEFIKKVGDYMLAEEKGAGRGQEVIRGYKYANDVINVANKIRSLFDELAKEFNIENYRERYYPHRLPQEFLRAMYEQSVTDMPKELRFWAEMIRKNKLQYLENDALNVMVTYIRTGLRKKYLGEIYKTGQKMLKELNEHLYKARVEYLRKKGLEWQRVPKTEYATTRYLRQWLEHDVLGKPTPWDEIFVGTMTQMWNGLRAALRRGEITEQEMVKHINTALNVTYASALGRPAAPIKNLTQFLFLGVPFVGYKAALKGIKLFLKKSQRQRLWDENVKVDFPFEREGALISGFTGRLGHAFDKFARTLMWAFDRADTFNRGTVYLGYDALIRELWNKLKAGKISEKQFFKKIKFNMHWEPVKKLAKEYFTKGDIDNFAKLLADQAQARTQFRYLQGNMPRIFRIAGRLPSRFIAQFGTWQLWYADLIRQAIKNKNWPFLAKMVGHGLAFAMLLDKLIGLNVKDWYLAGPFATYSGALPFVTGPVPQTLTSAYNYTLSLVQALQGAPYAKRRMKEEEWKLKRGLFFLVPGSTLWSSIYGGITAKDKTMRQRILRTLGFTPTRIKGWRGSKFNEMLRKMAIKGG